MSASAIRRKSYKKAQEDAGPFSPIHWEADRGGAGGEVPPGKLQVMEKFFTPVRQAKEGKGASEPALQDRRPPWAESRSDRFSTLSSSASPSASSSSASWSSEASPDTEAFLHAGSRFRPEHSQSCVDVSGEAGAFRRGRERAQAAAAAYPVGEAGGSVAWLRKGHSRSADRLARHAPGTRELPSPPGRADGVDRRLYKAASLERSLVLNEEAGVLAPRQPHPARGPAPSKGILKNGTAAAGEQLRKAKSIETITVRATGREPRPGAGLGPTRPLQRERQPPNSLDLSVPGKPPLTERMKLVEEKLRFSEFLNEITRQVMSPSSLTSLGWKPPEAAVAGKAPSTDGSDSKGSSSKASSPGSLLDVEDGKGKEAAASRGAKRGAGQLGAEGEAVPAACPPRGPAGAVSEAGGDPARAPVACLPATLGSLPRLSGEAGKVHREPGEAKAKHGLEAEGRWPPPAQVEREAAGVAAEPKSKAHQERAAAVAGPHAEELLAKTNVERPAIPQDKDPTTEEDLEPASGGHRTGISAQQHLQKTWEELGNLKEKFSKLQEEYSQTRVTNQLLEEKLQIIAQSMAEERQTLNQRVNELLERLMSAQSMICTLEKLNVSGLLSRSGLSQQCGKKAESLDSLCSLHLLDVAPPPAFMDGASEALSSCCRDSGAQPGCSSEAGPAGANSEQAPRLEFDAPTPPPEGPQKCSKSHGRAVASTPWRQSSTIFSAEQANSTESDCSGEETAPICPLSTSRFLYLRQETVAAPPGPHSFPRLPAPEPVLFETGCPPSPPSVPPSRQLELLPEPSSSESSDDGEVSWSPGLVEKTSASRLDYQSAQEMLDSLLHKSSEQERGREKGLRKGDRRGASPRRPGRSLALEHRIHCYQDSPGSGEGSPKQSGSPGCPHMGGPLLRAAKRVAAGPEAAQASTSL